MNSPKDENQILIRKNTDKANHTTTVNRNVEFMVELEEQIRLNTEGAEKGIKESTDEEPTEVIELDVREQLNINSP